MEDNHCFNTSALTQWDFDSARIAAGESAVHERERRDAGVLQELMRQRDSQGCSIPGDQKTIYFALLLTSAALTRADTDLAQSVNELENAGLMMNPLVRSGFPGMAWHGFERADPAAALAPESRL